METLEPKLRPRLIAQLRRNWTDEMRSAELYRRLARHLPEGTPRRALSEMSGQEMRHADRWRLRIEELGGTIPHLRLGMRERVLPLIGRFAGLPSVIGLVEAGEARERLGYLRQAQELPDAGSRAIVRALLPDEWWHRDIAAQLRGDGTDVAPAQSIRNNVGEFTRDLIFGLNDGLASNFSLIAGVSGAGTSRTVVVLAGVAGLLAGAFSMAAGAYLSHKSHREVIDKEVLRERDEITYAPDEARDELSRIYVAKGIPADEAEILVRRISVDPQRWLETLVTEKLGLSLRQGPSPMLDGICTGAGFGVGAAIPVIPFLAAGGPGALVASGILSLLALFTVGAAKSLVTARSALRSGVEMVVIGAGAALVTNIVGRLLGASVGS